MLNGNELRLLPENIDNLINLSTLSLANNSLFANFLESICNLTNLNSLNLSNNYKKLPVWGVVKYTLAGDILMENLKISLLHHMRCLIQ